MGSLIPGGKRRAVRALVGLTIVLIAGESAALGYFFMRDHWRRKAGGSAVVRGRDVAERSGCFGCHGPGGVRPIPNPGAVGGDVPGWAGGTWMMWNKKPEDLRSWIVRGIPPGREPDAGALIHMPPYGPHLASEEVDDLVAYVAAVSQFGWPEDPAVAEGREIGVKLGCFGCHGPEGRGLVSNPGSFKGYVPPWDGDDYTEVVRNDEEFRQWVRNGISDRFQSNPAARHFLDRQAVKMPAYHDLVSDADLSALSAYVAWVRANPRGVARR